jgi:hypothetical protein
MLKQSDVFGINSELVHVGYCQINSLKLVYGIHLNDFLTNTLLVFKAEKKAILKLLKLLDHILFVSKPLLPRCIEFPAQLKLGSAHFRLQ